MPGFFHCDRCNRVVDPPEAELDHQLDLPEARPVLKCPGCKHRSVTWHEVKVLDPVRVPRSKRQQPAPVSVERGRELIRQQWAQYKLNQ